MSNQPIYFDIETGGLNPSGNRASSVLSISQSRGRDIVSQFSKPVSGSWLSDFSKSNILPQLKGKSLISEKETIERFIAELESNRGSPLIGYNIKEYDIPFLEVRAAQYGLLERYKSAVWSRDVIDPITDIKRSIATAITAHADSGTFSDMFDGKTWAQTTADLGSKGRSGNKQYDIIRQATGYFQVADQDRAPNKKGMAGWTLEESFGLVKTHASPEFSSRHGIAELVGKAHESETDVRMTRIVHSALQEGEFDRIMQKPEAARQWVDTAVRIKEEKAVLRKSGAFSRGAAWEESLSASSRLSPRMKAGLGLAGITLGIGAVWLASNFSAKDDNYNTIEGLPHGGHAEQYRRALTSFGSGWQGLGAEPQATPRVLPSSLRGNRGEINELPSSLMGIPIDPEILAFRKTVLDDADKRRELQQDLKAREEESSGNLSSFRPSDLTPVSETTARIRLSDFDVKIDDADTLSLSRDGEEIQVRLAGIDAPETAGHEDDALEPVRIWQQQAGAAESSEVLKKLIAEQTEGLSLLVSTGKKTYGRYLGVLEGDDKKNLNIELARRGAVTALPFGNIEDDIVSRKALQTAENQAVRENQGIWQLKRYQALKAVQESVGRPITHNTLTRVDKLAGNLSLGAYGSWLQSMGDEKGSLSAWEHNTATRIGKSLSRRFGPTPQPVMSGKDDAHNSIEGLGHKGIAWQIRQQMTHFGSGVRGIFGFSKALGGAIGLSWGAYAPLKTFGKGLTKMVPHYMPEQVSLFKKTNPNNVRQEAATLLKEIRVAKKAGREGGVFIERGADWTEVGLNVRSTIYHERLHERFASSGLSKKLGDAAEGQQELNYEGIDDEIEKKLGLAPTLPSTGKSADEEKWHEKLEKYFTQRSELINQRTARFALKPVFPHNAEAIKRDRSIAGYSVAMREEETMVRAAESLRQPFSAKAHEPIDGDYVRDHKYSMEEMLKNKEVLEAHGVKLSKRINGHFPGTWAKRLQKSLNQFGPEDMRISGKDDAYNTIEGLGHSGIAHQVRQKMTDFGSGFLYDALAAIAHTAEFMTHPATLTAAATAGLAVAGKKIAPYLQRAGKQAEKLGFQTDRRRLLGVGAIAGGAKLLQAVNSGPIPVERAITSLAIRGAMIASKTESTRRAALVGTATSLLPGNISGTGQTASLALAVATTPLIAGHGADLARKAADHASRVRVSRRNFLRALRPPALSGKDDLHNTIEGLPHGGHGQSMRKKLTPFGSGWDALRNFTKLGEKFEDMLKSREFRSSLVAAKKVRTFGKGGMGQVHEMRTTFRGQDVNFIRKFGTFGDEEFNMMRKFQDDFAPSAYAFSATKKGNHYIDMEKMEGATFKKLLKKEELPLEAVKQYEQILGKMKKEGLVHGDAHADNVYLTPQGKVSLIDYGSSGKSYTPFGFIKGDTGEHLQGALSPGGAVGEELAARNAGIVIPDKRGRARSHFNNRDPVMDEAAIFVMKDEYAEQRAAIAIKEAKLKTVLDTKTTLDPPPGVVSASTRMKPLDPNDPVAMNAARARFRKQQIAELGQRATKQVWHNGVNGGRKANR